MFFAKFSELCSRKGISAYKACIEMGLNRSAVAKWKSGATPNGATLTKMTEYFGVSTDYLLGNEKTENAPVLTEKDERDIEKRLEAVLEDLENGQGSLAFSGEALDDDTRELLIKSLRNSMEVGKALAKKKYTPKKYRKE